MGALADVTNSQVGYEAQNPLPVIHAVAAPSVIQPVAGAMPTSNITLNSAPDNDSGFKLNSMGSKQPSAAQTNTQGAGAASDVQANVAGSLPASTLPLMSNGLPAPQPGI